MREPNLTLPIVRRRSQEINVTLEGTVHGPARDDNADELDRLYTDAIRRTRINGSILLIGVALIIVVFGTLAVFTQSR